MAITAVLSRATPNTLAYLLAHDGAAGDALTITNAVLLAGAVSGPLRELLQQGAANAGAAAAFLGGINPTGLASFLNPEPGFADMSIVPQVGSTAWTLIAGSDGTDMEIDVGNVAVAGGLLVIEFKHTVDR